MKEVFTFIPFFLSLLIGNAFAGQLETITPQNALKMQKNKTAIIVDVREPSELTDGMVKDAVSAPLSLMKEKEKWEKITAGFPKDKSVIVYCRSGKRAEMVGQELVKNGFTVLNMGSFDAWKTAGFPIDKK